MKMEVKYPDITVKLIGEDGNVFYLIGIVSKALRRNKIDPADFTQEVLTSKSYDEALQVMMKWVNVT